MKEPALRHAQTPVEWADRVSGLRFAMWLLALLARAAAPMRAQASGYYGPCVYLGEGGRLVDATPEFYWELEVKRLAE